MKVILIKDCKDGKANEIIEVSDGYGKNFLINKKMAIPLNSKNKIKLNDNLHKKEELEKANIDNAMKVKKIIEKLKIVFSLKSTNNVVHGSISKKQILNKLKENEINVDSHSISHQHINSMGITSVDIKLYKNIIAKLKVEVING